MISLNGYPASVNYDTQSSDHFPLSICIDINIVPMLDMQGSDSQSFTRVKLLIVNALPTRITAQNYSATFNSLERQYIARSPRAKIHSIASLYSDIPRQGDVFQSMKQSRARFKFKLRQCKREEARVRANVLANDLVKRNTKLFWKQTKS